MAPSLRRLLVMVAAAGVLTAACGSSPTRFSSPSTTTGGAGPLRAPKTTAAEDTAYVEGLTRADPALASYATERGQSAVRALLTDGAAFCAFLSRDGRIDGAMVDLGIAARGNESSTRLPLGVSTFNAIDSMALIALCPGDQRLLPAADRARLASEAKQLDLPDGAG